MPSTVRRGLTAGVVIALSTAGALAASVLLLAADLAPPGGIDAPVDPSQAGAPQTVMIVGSDRRGSGDGVPPRSDTIILVRLDAARRATTVTSIPRDLLVDLPGIGRNVKINAAYEQGGATGTMRAVKRLLSTPQAPFRIHRVIAVDFDGFRRAVRYVGCVFVDVDRDPFSAIRGPSHFA